MNPRDKAQEIVRNAPRAGQSLRLGDTIVRFLGDVRVEREGVVTVEAEITRNGQVLDISMPLYVTNPPVIVEDPAGPIEIVDEVTGTITRARVDGRRAFEKILLDFIRSV